MGQPIGAALAHLENTQMLVQALTARSKPNDPKTIFLFIVSNDIDITVTGGYVGDQICCVRGDI